MLPTHVQAALTDEAITDLMLALQGPSIMLDEPSEDGEVRPAPAPAPQPPKPEHAAAAKQLEALRGQLGLSATPMALPRASEANEDPTPPRSPAPDDTTPTLERTQGPQPPSTEPGRGRPHAAHQRGQGSPVWLWVAVAGGLAMMVAAGLLTGVLLFAFR